MMKSKDDRIIDRFFETALIRIKPNVEETLILEGAIIWAFKMEKEVKGSVLSNIGGYQSRSSNSFEELPADQEASILDAEAIFCSS